MGSKSGANVDVVCQTCIHTHTNYQWLCLPMNGCSRQIEFEANSGELIYNT